MLAAVMSRAVAIVLVVALFLGLAFVSVHSVREHARAARADAQAATMAAYTDRAKTRMNLLLACQKGNTTRLKINSRISVLNTKSRVLSAKVLRTERLHPGYYPPSSVARLTRSELLHQVPYVNCKRAVERVFEQVE